MNRASETYGTTINDPLFMSSRKKGKTDWSWKSTWKNMAENFSNLEKDINLQVQEAAWTTNKPQRNLHKHTGFIKTYCCVTVWKMSHKFWYDALLMEVTWMSVDFISETMAARRKWHNIFQVLKENDCHLGLIYSMIISFKNEGDIKTFSDEGKLRIC